MMLRSLCVVALVAGIAAARPALEPHEVGPVAISMPKGWAFTGDASKGIAIAKQDPSRKDGAQLMVVVSQNVTATEDQVIAALVGGAAQNLSIVKQGAGPNGTGTLVVADGTTDGLKVRLGAIAVVSSGTAVVGLLIAKQGDFDALGGIDLVASVLGSMRASGGEAAPSREPFMQPEYFSGSLVVPPLKRRLSLADVAGGWESNDGAGRAYANGGLQSGVVTHENWRFGADGKFDEVFKGAVMNGGNVRGIDQKNTGTVRIEPDGTLYIHHNKGQYAASDEWYVIKGWFYGADATIMKLNGPYHDPIKPADIANPDFNIYMNHLYVRRR